MKRNSLEYLKWLSKVDESSDERDIRISNEEAIVYIKSKIRNHIEDFDSKYQYELGMLYADLDTKESLKWYKLAAEQGHAEAQYELGMLYADLDTKESLKWFKLAAEKGHEEASWYISDANEHDWSKKDTEIAETVSEHTHDELSTNGDPFLSGKDIDLRIVAFLVEQFEKESGLDLYNDPLAIERLKEAAEKAKIDLLSAQQTEINLPYIAVDASGPKHLVQILERAKLESLSEDLVDKGMMPLETALDDAPVRIRLGKSKNYFNEDIRRSQHQVAEIKATEKENIEKVSEASVSQPITNEKPSHENYAEAFTEIENNKMKVGLWAMVFAHSENVEEAKKSYIKLRAEELHIQQQANNKQK